MQISEVQSRLAIAGLYAGAIDNLFGPRTSAAIDTLLLARPYANGSWQEWPGSRRLVAAGQIFCLLDGIEVGPIDGLIGPQTRHAFEVYDSRKRGVEGPENWRDHEPARAGTDANRNAWPRQTQTDMERFYGPVGQNQTTLQLPTGYPMRLAWDLQKSVPTFTCHERIHDAARRVLVRVLDHYGSARVRELGLDLFGGCLNVRRMRGGSAWSVHAWGAAIDFDPERNQLNWNRTRACFAQPPYEKWWELWEAEGFVSLGRTCDFDWMHVQAARL
jgi:peptidoglycan hydrolase-like protein with peptidoglycan-binding domain